LALFFGRVKRGGLNGDPLIRNLPSFFFGRLEMGFW
jgi:hypothetical protein